MPKPLKALAALLLLLSTIDAHAQLDQLFAPFDCREHAEFFHVVEAVEPVKIDSVVIDEPEVVIAIDTINEWREWTFVENYNFGKDRGAMPMINDLRALHPYFRDKITKLIAECKKQGIELAVVESYRTHAKQNEYKVMGKKYTSSGAGRSKHQYGLAVDIVPIVDSVAMWDNKQLWLKVGVVGEKLGLRWGGRWRKPYDPGHFEWTGGLTSVHLAHGAQPVIAEDQYPCVHDDLKLLRKYWKEWETAQAATARK